ncbi:hypothetical protein [Spirosoma linguale]|uniref:Aerotolerance regulator N-terminal domain-containing protein n=1 Tax=Spirosoma linguale (strain ATCC 33905 / DSM 74 / LMG 10896 / Claus 1) TaxID=504472 RepID=D2QM14_SPILD|nr:hypothetical protein Slin_1320 [Spirosoma linguale DSM 74]
MQTPVNWTEPITWFIALALVILLVGQLWLIGRNQSIATGRKSLRAGLNILLWLIVLGYFLQFKWQRERPATHALLVGDEVPSAVARQVRDSLNLQDSFTSRNLKDEYDSLTLIGQRFPTATLTQISQSALQWIPYTEPNSIQSLHWKGIVRQGEIQRVTGRIQSLKNALLRVKFGNRTLDSVTLHEGENTFSLKFPAFSRGRTQTELVLGKNTLDTVRYFTRPIEPLTVVFLLNSPDFESNTLAGWLGKQGHTVQVSTTLSKNISSNVSINKAGKSVGKTTPDLIITESANAANPTVRKAVADGKAVLFINITNPEIESRAINQALGSRWQVRKTGNEATVPVGNGLTALPYRFTDNLNQFAVTGYPIAVQRSTRGSAGRIGVSLLSETYPLSLSGDSVSYNRVWTAVLARLSSADKPTIQVNSPVYSGLQQQILVNNTTGTSRKLIIGQDTVTLTPSPVNERSAVGLSLFRQTGWQPAQDSLALFVNARNQSDPVAERQTVSRFMLAHAQANLSSQQPSRTTTSKVPNWVWLVLFLGCFTALWIEPKLV